MIMREARTIPDGLVFDVESSVGGCESLEYRWGGADLPQVENAAPAGAIALLPAALGSTDETLHIDGALPAGLLESLQEWADAWAFMRPDLYSRISVTASEILHERPAAASRDFTAAIAFSGGIDSLYSTLSHLDDCVARGEAANPVLALVHGFDIALDADEDFATALANAQRSADVLELPLAWVRTNWRRDFSNYWSMEFACGVASVLHLWRDTAREAVIGSDDGSGYGFEVFPWSSNPATNHLLGSPGFPFHTKGFAATRTEKCARVAQWTALLDTVRVCYQVSGAGSNCGRCEKCVRTKFSFAAAGIRDVPALGNVSVEELMRVKLLDPHFIPYFEQLLTYEPQHLSESEQKSIKRFLGRERTRQLYRAPYKRLRGSEWLEAPLSRIARAMGRHN